MVAGLHVAGAIYRPDVAGAEPFVDDPGADTTADSRIRLLERRVVVGKA